MAALVTILNLSVLAGRVGGRVGPHRGMVLVWSADQSPAADRPPQAPSNPVRSFSAGQLTLDAGMAIVRLAAWLGIMRINGARGQ